MTRPEDIVPDTKDWTWILHRPCPECGFDSAQVELDGIAAQILSQPARWRSALERPEAAVRPRPGRWSTLEYACHVRDVYRIFAGRLELMLTRDEPRYENWDQDAAAIAGRYAEQQPGTVAQELDAAARTLADVLEPVRGAQWDRPGRRIGGPVFTVGNLALCCLHEAVHHLHDVEA